MVPHPTGAPDAPRPASGHLVRVLVILGALAGLAILVAILAERYPAFDAETLRIGLLPVSAAAALVVVCRRIDLSLPFLFTMAAALFANRFVFESEPLARAGTVLAIAAGIGLGAALVTWFGRVSSALWTILAAGAMIAVTHHARPVPVVGTVGGWPWPAAVGGAMGLLLVGAAGLGWTGLVWPPSHPPLLAVGAKGLAGLAPAWTVAAAAVGMAALSENALGDPETGAFVLPMAAVALGGAYVLRGRWAAVAAVVLAGLAHVVVAAAGGAEYGTRSAEIVLTALLPLAAVPVYLILDALVRQRTGESAPTGLLT